MPPAPGIQSPLLWGTKAHLNELFANTTLQHTLRNFNFRYRSAEHFVEVFRSPLRVTPGSRSGRPLARR